MYTRTIFLTIYLFCFGCFTHAQEQDDFHKDYLIVLDTGFCMAGFYEEYGTIAFVSSSKQTLDQELQDKMTVYRMLFEDIKIADCILNVITPCERLPTPHISDFFFSTKMSYESRIVYYRVALTMAIETKIIDFGESNHNLISDEYLYSINDKIRVKPFFKNSYVWPRILSMSIIDSNGEMIWTR